MKLDQKAKQYSEAMFNVAIESQSEIDIKDLIAYLRLFVNN